MSRKCWEFILLKAWSDMLTRDPLLCFLRITKKCYCCANYRNIFSYLKKCITIFSIQRNFEYLNVCLSAFFKKNVKHWQNIPQLTFPLLRTGKILFTMAQNWTLIQVK